MEHIQLVKRTHQPTTPPPITPAPTQDVDDAKAKSIRMQQKRWDVIGKELPAQINRRHISVISIGGVIGTGLYIGTSTALRHSGPIGTLIAYIITGTVVWSVVISIGEIVAFLPNVGGPVGLASIYVDKALGFALGWNAWYNWTIILPAELSAAAILSNTLISQTSLLSIRQTEFVVISVLLIAAIGINCFGARAYGEAEFSFSLIKILTILTLIIMGIVIDAGGWQSPVIGIKYWKDPGPFVNYRSMDNDKLGNFLGVWSAMSQAVFAFFGTEVPGVAAGEVINPLKNIPRAINRVWIRITLFYVLAVFVAGLLVPSDDCMLFPDSTSRTDCKHYPNDPAQGTEGQALLSSSPFIIAIRSQGSRGQQQAVIIMTILFIISAFSAAVSDVYISSRFLYSLARFRHAPRIFADIYKTKSGHTVVPRVGVLVAAAFALLAFMTATDAEEAFHWLSAMTSTTALLSWIGMLVTYIRWYQGTMAAERRDPDFKKTHKKDLYDNRYKWQPWIAIYALVMCTLITIFNGWFVFTRQGPWRMANELGDIPVVDQDIGNWVPTFVTSYITIPVFFLLVLGYKMIYRTTMVDVDNMSFDRGNIPEIDEDPPKTWWGKVLATVF